MIQIPTISGFVSLPKIDFGADLSPQLAQIYGDATGFLRGYDFNVWVADIKVIAIILSVVFGVIFAIIFYKSRKLVQEEFAELKGGLNPPEEAITAYDNRWEEIKSHVNSFKESDWKMAVIEADKFTDDVLKSAGFPGESMGERLMLIKPDQLLNLQYLWDAHKLRNLLVHDTHYEINHRQAILAIEAFERTLRELEALS